MYPTIIRESPTTEAWITLSRVSITTMTHVEPY